MSDELKRRARRRLIGAVVIALTAAIVLPMVMDSEPRRPEAEIDVRIPAPEALGPLPAPKSPATSALPSVPVAPEPSKGAGAQVRDRSPNPVSPQAALPAVEKPATSKAPRTDDDRRARNILEAHAGSYVVQLGAFAESANVRRVEERVKKLGYPVYSEVMRSEGGGKTRVRAGPFSSREDAQAARDKLAHAGLTGIVAEK